jgi:uncharacterized phage protein (TIGR02216 family)
MTPFPWKEAMRFGLGVLRLPPAAFWAMTPRELGAAWSAVAGERARPLDRPGLEQLMERFPDGR